MPQVTLDMSTEEIKELIFQLPPMELLKIAEEIEERAETIGLMHVSETAFQEWNQPGEDIYDADA